MDLFRITRDFGRKSHLGIRHTVAAQITPEMAKLFTNEWEIVQAKNEAEALKNAGGCPACEAEAKFRKEQG